MNDITDRKVLVVGASSGGGRDIATSLAARGARVAFAARRADLVDEAARAAGDHCVGLPCDVRDEGACADVVAAAADRFGGLDTLVYAAAIATLADLREADASLWRESLEINLIGASLITAAAVPHLETSGNGRAIYLSSESASGTPWPGLGLYAASKAALERLVETWRSEVPAVRFSTIILGPFVSQNEAPTSLGSKWDFDKAAEMVPRWARLGHNMGPALDESYEIARQSFFQSTDLCEQVLTILTTSASISTVSLDP